MVVGEPDRVAVEPVQVGSRDDGVAVAAEIAVALVVGQDEYDIGSDSLPAFHRNILLVFRQGRATTIGPNPIPNGVQT